MSEYTQFNVEGRVFHVSHHAVLRLQESGVTLEQVTATLLEGEQFRFFHEGSWKDGYHHPLTRMFVSVADDTIVTVMVRVRSRYIDNLKAGAQ